MSSIPNSPNQNLALKNVDLSNTQIKEPPDLRRLPNFHFIFLALNNVDLSNAKIRKDCEDSNQNSALESINPEDAERIYQVAMERFDLASQGEELPPFPDSSSQ